ncbi:MAG: YqaA family protein [Candidatus Hecatellaceae archaeon]
MTGIEQALLEIVQELGVLGVFAASFIGASSIFIPIPYHVLIFWVGANTNYNVYLIVAAAGLGSAIGEMVGYGAGYAAKRVFSETRRRRLDAMLKVLLRHRKIWPLLVFLFALTPLPDDVIFVPLGIVRMDFVRVFVPCVFGKLAMFYVLVAGGRYLGDAARGVLSGGEVNVMITAASIIVFIIILVIMLKIDWEKILAKYESYLSRFQPFSE